jgi:hypothetical protein
VSKEILVVGVHSYNSPHRVTGIQHIAYWLGQKGLRVSYLPVPSSPLDFIGAERRKRLKRVWFGGSVEGWEVSSNVLEYEIKALVPMTKYTCWSSFIHNLSMHFYPEELLRKEFDSALFDVGPNIAWFDEVKASKKIIRINDLPSRFERDLPQWLLKKTYEVIKSADEVWTVSSALYDWAKKYSSKVTLFQNGVGGEFFKKVASRESRKAVFVGAIGKWVDFELVNEAAVLLPEWEFNFYGPLDTPWIGTAPNVFYRGLACHDAVPTILAQHAVGLLPYKDAVGIQHYLECPLKAYEFAAVGLGIAASNLTGFKQGMRDYPCYGQTAEEFAEAIECASVCTKKSFVGHEMAWSVIVDNMVKKLW